MTLQECYDRFHGDYEGTKRRMTSDTLIAKFLGRFPDDDTMPRLAAAMSATDQPEAFRMAHTLKGLAANLGLTRLQEAAHELCESLRDHWGDDAPALYNTVLSEYQTTVDAIKAFTGGNT